MWLKLEGANPTGSFKDRGMTCAVSAAVREGAEAVICASTGNTAASAAAYAARAGLTGAVIVPEGKIATGKLAQALMHGARVIALRGNFDEALALVRELVERHPIALGELGQPVPARGAEDGGVRDRRGARADRRAVPSRSATRATSPPTGRASRRPASAPRMLGFQAEGAAPLVHGAPVAHPETVASAIRIGNPARWEEAMGAMTASHGAVARGLRRSRSSTPTASSPRTRACSASRRRPPAWPACSRTAPRARERVVCVLTGHGLKDPQTALAQAGSVVPCEPDIAAVERAVLG